MSGLVRLSLLIAALGFVAGCGSAQLEHTLGRDKLRDMSRRGQLWIYDAENEIIVALDQLDEAHDLDRDVGRRIRAAQDAIDRAEKRGGAAVEMAGAWREQLEVLKKWTEDQIEVRNLGVLLARANFELAKAQVIQREDLLGGKKFSPKQFREQADRLEDRFERRNKQNKELRKRAREAEAKWWDSRRRYVAQSADYDTGLWLE